MWSGGSGGGGLQWGCGVRIDWADALPPFCKPFEINGAAASPPARR